MRSENFNSGQANELLEGIAAQNRAAACIPSITNITTVEFDESAGQFAVRCNGEIIEWFRTLREAEGFAEKHDHITPGGGNAGGENTASR